ncbi:hypothetical protein DFP72DRAFT_1042307 [Ephemerocybe angulata]|uniref:RRM domain-containing protein n=1 Tax=Ephemerocybe angulata TaxID=980116 RepID=A0A8H6IAB0_9AGAR|nr:hypothetical protein DFP72DRAFT_1042307 [Tulosesus angulatus]
MADPTPPKPQDPKAPVTKRLHIGGLTPSITLADLNKRLATFGTIEGDISGLGKVDAVGRTKNFVHVTLKTNVGQLAKCMNVLSGSTWKGAKLKLSEAKPDYTERLEAEHAENARLAAEPPRKKQRRNVGVAAPQHVARYPLIRLQKGGVEGHRDGSNWRRRRRRTRRRRGRGRRLRVRRFKKGKSNEEKKEERRRRKRDPLVRARRVTIDVTKWESTQLKGMFLESQGAGLGKKTLREDIREEEVDEDDTSSEEDEEELSHLPPPAPPRAPPPAPNPTFAVPTTTYIPDNNTNLTLEKSRALNLLSSLFPNADAADEDDWIGRESAGSDVDEEELLKEERKAAGHAKGRAVDVEFEVVPRDDKRKVSEGKEQEQEESEAEESDGENGEESDGENEEEMDEGMDVDTREEKEAEKEVKEATPAPVVQAAPNLKDLFAPREEEAGFSLLGHLDLDLDLDEELAFAIAPPQEPTPQPSFPTTTSSPRPPPRPAAASIYINPREPLFFSSSQPPQSKSPHPSTLFFTTNPHKKAKDTFDLMAEKGWYWRDEACGFIGRRGRRRLGGRGRRKRGS